MASSDCKQAPRGKPKSGRVWKSVKEKSFGNLHRQKQLKTSWSKKMAIKRERQLVKAFEQELKDAKATEEEERKKRRKENIKRKEENARKSEIVQKIKNPAKLKKMKKKHLRMVRKT